MLHILIIPFYLFIAIWKAAAQTVSTKLQNKYDKILDEVDNKMKVIKYLFE